MKLKRFIKRIAAVSLATVMVVTCLPSNLVVKAGPDDYPDEILFPVSILDIPNDGLFFECAMSWNGNWNSQMDTLGAPGGKGLLMNELESDPDSIYYGCPVYNQKYVQKLAEQVQDRLSRNLNTSTTNNVDRPFVDGTLNPISIRNYVTPNDVLVMDASDTYYKEEYTSGTSAWATHYTELNNCDNENGCVACLKENRVRGIGGDKDGKVTFWFKNKFNTTKNIKCYIYYILGDANKRSFKVTVNNTWSTNVDCTKQTCASWDDPNPGMNYYQVALNNLTLGENKIEISGIGGGAWAPDLDRIELRSGSRMPAGTYTFEAEGDANSTATAKTEWWCGNTISGGYANIAGWNNQYSLTLKKNKIASGNYTVNIYYKKAGSGGEYYDLIVNGTNYGGKQYAGNTDSSINPITYTNVAIKGDGTDKISINGNDVSIDKFVFTGTEAVQTKASYPLGNYNDAKAKYNIAKLDNDGDPTTNPKYGYWDIETCYDYAYFVMANIFKQNSTYNKAYTNYNNLVFHKVEETTGSDGKKQTYYEFRGDSTHKGEADGLIFNPGMKSIRNGKSSEVDTSKGEYRLAPGQMFIADGDDCYKAGSTAAVGTGVKKYPNFDPAETADDKKKHNFHFTVHTHSRFVYKADANQYFEFTGDDDVYVFLNGKLLIDLGGQHEALTGRFNLDDMALEAATDPTKDYGLIDGKAVDFDFYYVERHCTASNFWSKMSFKLETDEVKLNWDDRLETMDKLTIPYGYVIPLNYSFTTNRELTTDENITFSDQLGNYIGKDNFKLGEGTTVKEKFDEDGNSLGYVMTVTVKRAKDSPYKTDKTGKNLVETREFIFDDPNNISASDVLSVTDYFSKLKMAQGDSLLLDGLEYDTSVKKFQDYDATEDASIKELYVETKVNYTQKMDMGGTGDAAAIDSEQKDTRTVKVIVGQLTVKASVEDENLKKDLSAYGKFTIKRLQTTDPNLSIVYTNDFKFTGTGSVIDFKAPDRPLPRGKYKLNMDVSMLQGYKMYVETRTTYPDGTVESNVFTKKTDSDEYDFDSLYLELEPDLYVYYKDPNNPTDQTKWKYEWRYPTVEYILKAVRETNPLKDLT